MVTDSRRNIYCLSQEEAPRKRIGERAMKRVPRLPRIDQYIRKYGPIAGPKILSLIGKIGAKGRWG